MENFRAYVNGQDISGICTSKEATAIAAKAGRLLGKSAAVLGDDAARALGYVGTRGEKI